LKGLKREKFIKKEWINCLMIKKTILAAYTFLLAACNVPDSYLPVQDYIIDYPDTGTPDVGLVIDESCCKPLNITNPNGTKQTLINRLCQTKEGYFFQHPNTKKYHKVHIEEPKDNSKYPIELGDYLIVTGAKPQIGKPNTTNFIRYKQKIGNLLSFQTWKNDQPDTGFWSKIQWDDTPKLIEGTKPTGIYRGGFSNVYVEGYVAENTLDADISANLNLDTKVGKSDSSITIINFCD